MTDMSSEENKDYVTVGKIAGAFGVKGEVRVKTNNPAYLDYLEAAEKFHLKNHPFILTPLSCRRLNDGIAFKFKEAPDRNAADALPRDFILLPRSAFPPPDEEDGFLTRDILGFAVLFENEKIGEIINCYDFGAAPVFEMKTETGQEFMFPYLETTVEKIDWNENILLLLPDALANFPKPPSSDE